MSVTVSPSPTNQAPTIAATISDVGRGGSNIVSAQYFIDNGPAIPLNGAFGSPTVNFTATLSTSTFNALADGTHTVYMQGADAAGNWGAFLSATFVKDTVAPSVTLSSVATPSSITTPAFTGTGGLVAGNSVTVTVTVYSGSSASGTPVETLSATVNATSGAYSVSASPALAAGTYTALASQADSAGNLGLSAATTFAIQTQPPVVSALTVTPNPTNTAPSIVAGISSGGSNVAAADYFIDTVGANGSGIALSGAFGSPTVSASGTLAAAAFSALSQGAHTIYVQGEDAAGNWGPVVSATFVKDTLSPETLSVTVSPSPTNQAPTIAATISDVGRGGSNIVSAQYFIDNGPAIPLNGAFGSPTVNFTATLSTSTFNALADGTHTVYVQGADAAGNWGAFLSATFVKDMVAPVVTLNSVATPSGNTTPAFAGAGGLAAGDSGTVTVAVYSGSSASGTPVETLSAAVNATSGAYSVSASPALAAGTYTALASQTDWAGNTGLGAAVTFTVSTAAPTVMLSPVASLSNNPMPVFNGVGGIDAGDSNTVTIDIYSGSNTSGKLVQTFGATCDATCGDFSAPAPSALLTGTYTAQAGQTNSAGNTGLSAAITFTIR